MRTHVAASTEHDTPSGTLQLCKVWLPIAELVHGTLSCLPPLLVIWGTASQASEGTSEGLNLIVQQT